jgi:hypothetical protein
MANPTVRLDGEKIELACTLGVARGVSRLANALDVPGGPRKLAQLAIAGDLDAITIAIVAASGGDYEDVANKVWAKGSGSADLTLPVSDFYFRLANGGKPLTKAKGEVQDEGADPQS